MGQIVFAAATVHAPQLFVYPPSEDPKQLDADIAAMHHLGTLLDETKPDLAIVIGSDHLGNIFSVMRCRLSQSSAGCIRRRRSRARLTRCRYIRSRKSCWTSCLAGFDMVFRRTRSWGIPSRRSTSG